MRYFALKTVGVRCCCLSASASRAVLRAQAEPICTRPSSNAAKDGHSNDSTRNDLRDEKSLTLKRKKTMAELDTELREKLEGRSGDGGAAGLELEDGKPAAMKRSVRENMFRLI